MMHLNLANALTIALLFTHSALTALSCDIAQPGISCGSSGQLTLAPC